VIKCASSHENFTELNKIKLDTFKRYSQLYLASESLMNIHNQFNSIPQLYQTKIPFIDARIRESFSLLNYIILNRLTPLIKSISKK